MAFTMRLADKIIAVNEMYDSTRTFCGEYLQEGTPEFSVTVTQADIDFEREKSAREDALEGIPVRHFSDAYLETLAVYRKIADWMLTQNTLLFHGSAIAVDGTAFLFTAKSGTGKSTHTRLWRQYFGDRAIMVNDDKPLLQIKEDGVWVCGTPWDGKHRLSTNVRVPLQAICVLERGEENQITAITAKEALPMLMQQSYRNGRTDGMFLLLDLLDRLAKQVRFYRLQCTMDPEAAAVAYAGMHMEK